MTHVNRSRRKANERRRKAIAESRKPLPLEVQSARANATWDAHCKRYPHPPQLDPMSQVRGDPSGRDEPAPPTVRGDPDRKLSFADMLRAFGPHLAFLARRRNRAA